MIILPQNLVAGDYCRCDIPLRSNPNHVKIRTCQVHEVIEREGAEKIFRVATASRRDLVAIPQGRIIRGWRKM